MSRKLYKKGDIVNLILLSREGDIKALEELIRRTQKQVYTMFSHLTNNKNDISDLTQEVLLKIAKSIKTLNEPSSFKTWVNKIVTNTFYDYVRKKKDSIVDIDESKFNEIKDKINCEPGEKCFFSELEKLVRAALMTLPQDLRLTLILREYEGLSYQDIAKITNSALGTVKSRISRARFKLQQELKEFI